MVDNNNSDRFPSPEPRTDSGSALPREFRAWQWLRIVKRDESFSLIFSPQTRIYGVGVEVGGDPGVDLSSSIFYIFQNNSPLIFRSFRELLFLHKNNNMAILAENSVSPG